MLRVVADPPTGTTRVHSPVLGPIEVEMGRIIDFLEPLAGFPTVTRYGVLPYAQGGGREDPTMRWLQAMEPPFQTFVITDPWSVVPDYEPEISDGDARQLEAWSFDHARFFGILTVSLARRELTINLRGPLVVNMTMRLGKQVVLLNGEYLAAHRVCELP